MPSLVVVGAQWGDEGKGKVVDLFAETAQVVVRYGGGANAGHTLVIGETKLVTHLIPSGVLRAGTKCVLGDGMVIDPQTLLEELAQCRKLGLLAGDELLVGESAHVIFPYHRRIEACREDRAGALGTTRRGIGPAYESKAARRGVRMRDLLRGDRLRELVMQNLEELTPVILHFGGQAFTSGEIEAFIDAALAAGETLRPYIGSASRWVSEALGRGENTLLEGAQGCLLDLDHGTYPFVTSSTTVAGGACAGVGIGPRQIDRIVGITKAYATRVGEGPFPTELHGDKGDALRAAGAEFGATTGRPRRCGWLDVAALRAAIRTSGIDALALTKLDVLSGQPELQVAVAYELDGRELDELPLDPVDIERAVPKYAIFPGWTEDLGRATSIGELPAAAQNYLEAVSRYAGVPFDLVSVGPDRNETIRLRAPFSA